MPCSVGRILWSSTNHAIALCFQQFVFQVKNIRPATRAIHLSQPRVSAPAVNPPKNERIFPSNHPDNTAWHVGLYPPSYGALKKRPRYSSTLSGENIWKMNQATFYYIIMCEYPTLPAKTIMIAGFFFPWWMRAISIALWTDKRSTCFYRVSRRKWRRFALQYHCRRCAKEGNGPDV